MAAVSSAVVLSTLGVAGTIIGAAVGSVVASIGSAIYTRAIDTSREQVATQAAALRRVTQARTELDRAVSAVGRGDGRVDTGIRRAQAKLTEAEDSLAEDALGQAPQDAAADPADPAGADDPLAPTDTAGRVDRDWRNLPWRRIVLLAVAAFVAVMVAISGFELITGRAVSTYTGGSNRGTGSTVPLLRPAKNQSTGTPTSTPTPSATPSSTPSTSTSPGETPTAGSTPSPTVLPTPTPSVTVTPSPSTTPELSTTPTPSTG